MGSLVTKLCLTLVTPRTVALQAPLSMGLSRQEYWSGLPFPSPGNLLEPGIESRSSALQADILPTEPDGGRCVEISIHINNLMTVKSVLSPKIKVQRP